MSEQDSQTNTNESNQSEEKTLADKLYNSNEDVQEGEVETKETLEKPEEVKEEKPEEPQEIILEKSEDDILDNSQIEEIARYAKEQGLSQEQANYIKQSQNDLLDKFISNQEAEENNRIQAWEQEIKDDKEFGQAKFQDNVNHAHQALKQFGDENFIKELNETGYGNHPGLFKVFARIGEALKNDSFVHGLNNETNKPKTIAEKFYGYE